MTNGKDGWQMSDEELGAHAFEGAGFEPPDFSADDKRALGAAIRALFPRHDATPKRDELAEVRADITRTASVINTLEMLAREFNEKEFPGIIDECSEREHSFLEMLRRERELMAGLGEATNKTEVHNGK